MKTSIINGDPYHCRCYSIDPFYIENFEEVIQMKKRLIHYLKDNKIDTNIS